MERITVATFSYPHELAIAKSKLEAYGIACYERDAFTVEVNPFYSNAVGGIKLEVEKEQAPRALEILAENNELQADYPESKITCQHCGSGNVEGLKYNGKISMLFWLILGFPIPILSSKYHCYDCHKEYAFEKNKTNATKP